MTDIDWKRIAREAERRFGIREFRPGQRELIDAVLSGRHALGIMPIGAGKSLTYQLPALFLPQPIVVVSPLTELMRDQRDKTEDADLPAVDSTLSTRNEHAAIKNIAEGEARLIFVTPEQLENPDYLTLLARGGVARVVIDEAHCISQWGHDFRPAYLTLRNALRQLGRPPVLALTATAPVHVARDILQQLDIEDARVVTTGAGLDNLVLEVRRTPTDSAKREALLEILRNDDGAAIVYVATVRSADELHTWLCEHGVAAARYHGELRPNARADAQDGFMTNRYRVVVVTKAFGFGIDKPDIRLVLHYHFPDSPETYYQEAGRAGRDGVPARAILLYRLEDRRIQSYFLSGKYPRRDEAQRLYRALRQTTAHDSNGATMRALSSACDLTERRTKVLVAQLEMLGIIERRRRRLFQRRHFAHNAELEHFLVEYEQCQAAERQRLDAMMQYAQSTLCRLRYLRNYLGDQTDTNCARCDNCRQPTARLPRAPVRRRARFAPIAPASPKGQRVWHASFGEGEVLARGGEHFTVNFPRAGVKRILASYLKLNRPL